MAGKGVEKCTESDYIRDYEQYVSEASLYFGEKSNEKNSFCIVRDYS